MESNSRLFSMEYRFVNLELDTLTPPRLCEYGNPGEET